MSRRNLWLTFVIVSGRRRDGPTPIEGHVVTAVGAPAVCKKPSHRAAFPAISPPHPARIDRMDRRTRDPGVRSFAPVRAGCPLSSPPSPPSVSLSFPTLDERGNFPPAPGRSFGCGGAIKNSPVSGAWIADGTDEPRLVRRESPIASRLSISRDARFFIYSPSFAFALSLRDSPDWRLYQQVHRPPRVSRDARFITRSCIRTINQSLPHLSFCI